MHLFVVTKFKSERSRNAQVILNVSSCQIRAAHYNISRYVFFVLDIFVCNYIVASFYLQLREKTLFTRRASQKLYVSNL